MCRGVVCILTELPQGALPPESYTPIGQGAPLRPRPHRPKPLLSLKLGPAHPGPHREEGEVHTACQSTSRCLHNVWHSILMSQHARIELCTVLRSHTMHSDEWAFHAYHACHCSESRARMPCVPFPSRIVRKIALNQAFATYLAFHSDESACPHALRAIPMSHDPHALHSIPMSMPDIPFTPYTPINSVITSWDRNGDWKP